MNKITSIALLIVGVMLISFGLSASESIASGFSRIFTGAPTDETVWYMIGGIIAFISGLIGLLRKTRN